MLLLEVIAECLRRERAATAMAYKFDPLWYAPDMLPSERAPRLAAEVAKVWGQPY